jgi:hypothetical protein
LIKSDKWKINGQIRQNGHDCQGAIFDTFATRRGCDECVSATVAFSPRAFRQSSIPVTILVRLLDRPRHRAGHEPVCRDTPKPALGALIFLISWVKDAIDRTTKASFRCVRTSKMLMSRLNSFRLCEKDKLRTLLNACATRHLSDLQLSCTLIKRKYSSIIHSSADKPAVFGRYEHRLHHIYYISV